MRRLFAALSICFLSGRFSRLTHAAECPFGNRRSALQVDVDHDNLERRLFEQLKTKHSSYNDNKKLNIGRNLEEGEGYKSSADINKYFVVDSYETAKQETYNDVSNMLIVTWDTFYLYQNGLLLFTNQTWSGAAPLDDSIYTLTKTISHTVLGAFGTCYNGMSLLAEESSTMGGCKAMYEIDNSTSRILSPDDFILSLDLLQNVTVDKDLKEAVPEEAYPKLKDSSDAIILHFKEMMTDILAADCSFESFSSALRTKFNSTATIIKPLLDAAAADRLQNYGGIIKNVRNDLGEDAWKDIMVMFQGGGPPRTANYESAIIMKEMMDGVEEHPTGTRFFVEENADLDTLKMLAKGRTSDLLLSESVFGNKVHMSKDLLADYSIEVLGSFFMPGYPDYVEYHEDYYYNICDELVKEKDDTTKVLSASDSSAGVKRAVSLLFLFQSGVSWLLGDLIR